MVNSDHSPLGPPPVCEACTKPAAARGGRRIATRPDCYGRSPVPAMVHHLEPLWLQESPDAAIITDVAGRIVPQGSIVVESALGQGSPFKVFLPCGLPEVPR